MTSNVKVLIAALAGPAMAVMIFVTAPSNSAPGAAVTFFAQDDGRDLHSSRFAQGSGLYGDPDQRDPQHLRLARSMDSVG